MMPHSSSELYNAKFHRSWDIIPSYSIYVKVMHFISSGKGDTGLIISPLKKIGTPLLSIWVRVNIEESPHFPTHSIMVKMFFLSLDIDRRKSIMYPRPHTTILTWNNFIYIELSGPPSLQCTDPLCLEIHIMVVLLF